MDRRTEAGAMIGLDVLEQLCSRICHDLAGPIGAIRNGLELIEDAAEGEQGETQALDLIGHSAEQAARRLRLFRLAYGRSTREGVRSFSDVREAALDWLAGGRITLQWPAGQPSDRLAVRAGLARLLLNMTALASEAIPQGGVVAVTAGGLPEAGWASVAATGRGVKWSAEVAEALAGRASPDVLGPRTIHAAVTGRFAEQNGLSLSWETPNPETLMLRLSW